MGEAHFRTPPLRNPSTNFDVGLMLNILGLLRPPRELMCKIWFESIRPLRICACVKKHGLCGFFINISVCLSVYLSIYFSVRFFVGATGHSFWPISLLLTYTESVCGLRRKNFKIVCQHLANLGAEKLRHVIVGPIVFFDNVGVRSHIVE